MAGLVGLHVSRSEGSIVVLRPGLQTTVQDVHGRLGYWMVGVPPSGAMDNLSLALTNRIVGNDDDAAGLEMTVLGPSLRFERSAVVALGGAPMDAKVDGRPVPFWEPLPVGVGSELSVGRLLGAGMRSYLAVSGGIDVPLVLGSRSTFALGGFGGHDGRELAAGDRLLIGREPQERTPFGLRLDARPEIGSPWC
ncbi:MAG: biotin-dependent carboxyltransferase family protein, partial [Actinomycetota bacterium]